MSVVGQRKTPDCSSGRMPPLVVSRVPLNAATAPPLAVPKQPGRKRKQKHHEQNATNHERPEGLQSTTPSSILGAPNFNTVPWNRPAVEDLNSKGKREGTHFERMPTPVSVDIPSEEAVVKVLPTTEHTQTHCSSRFALSPSATDTETSYKSSVEENIDVRPLTMGDTDKGDNGDETKEDNDGDDGNVESSVSNHESDDEEKLLEKEGMTNHVEHQRRMQAQQDRNTDNNIKTTTDESGNGLRRSRRLLNHRQQPPPQPETKHNSAPVTSVQVHNVGSKGPRPKKATDQEPPQPELGPVGRSPMTMADWEIAPGILHRGSGRDTENIAFSSSYLAQAHTVAVADGTTFQVVRISPGTTLRWAADENMVRLCSVARGVVRVSLCFPQAVDSPRASDIKEFSIGPDGMWKVTWGAGCTLVNPFYEGVVLHITTLVEDRV
ncbi:uncharacterized protein C8A04DRAFT_32968 [Dichotomopilus funicola]|uniref:Uncharacterized protein n=1 Tax=Dichotomopilus funicola TaxID=1934379 RepID=A0AAN6ZIC3_9PEZI|nr:hypothetical protein C8A04DRAFT_32968 [Dichotomopilus funicola]